MATTPERLATCLRRWRALYGMWWSVDWYAYLLAPRHDSSISWRTVMRCRARGHRGLGAGPIWQNLAGLEPNMRCRTCDDDLG